jgi:uncharacterized protein (DUF1499 family)
MTLAWLTLFDGILAVLLAAIGILCAHFAVAPPPALHLSSSLFGFLTVVLGLCFSLFGLLIGIIALLVTFIMPTRRPGRAPAIIGFILVLAVFLPIAHFQTSTSQYPPINDITTDTKNPPTFTHAQDLPGNNSRDMSYKPETAAAQEAAPVYRDLKPLQMPGSPDDVYKHVEIVAGENPDWQVTYRNSQDRVIEGIATSPLFRFKDDFIIQIRADPSGSGSLVEMRSKSREGKSDLGMNYNRIERFFSALQSPVRGVVVPPTG